MRSSFRAISAGLDRVRPARGIRELAGQHRWRSDVPPTPLSLRRMMALHHHPQTTRSRFLWLNTELLPSIDVDLPHAVGQLDGTGLDAGLPDEVHILGGVAVAERAGEIGRALVARAEAQPYHVAALCEVYEPASRDHILSQLITAFGASRVEAAEGPTREGSGQRWPTVTSSGLLDVTVDRPIVRRERRAFRPRGRVHVRDLDGFTVDLFANKGVLLTEIDLGVGNIDLYSTHLYSGVNAISQKLGNAANILAIQEGQVRQIAGFINATHTRENVALLVGDFNMAATDEHFGDVSRPYDRLRQTLRSFGDDHLRMDDLWRARVSQARDGDGALGYTWTYNAESSAVCRLDGPYCDDFQPEPALTNPEGDLLHDNYRRIDYIFVEAPSPGHTFDLNLTRPRRRSFPRTRATHGKAFLSDHLALETTLIASPV